MFSMKAKINYEIFTVNLLSKWQIDGEDFVIFCGLLRKNEPYHNFERNENRATGFLKSTDFRAATETLNPPHIL